MNDINNFYIGNEAFTLLDMCKILGTVVSRVDSLEAQQIIMSEISLTYPKYSDSLFIDCNINDELFESRFQHYRPGGGRVYSAVILDIKHLKVPLGRYTLRSICHGQSLLCLPIVGDNDTANVIDFNYDLLHIKDNVVEVIQLPDARDIQSCKYEGGELTLTKIDNNLHGA